MTSAGVVLLLGLVPGFESWHEALDARGSADEPIVVYVSRTDCTFCRRFEEDVLGPVLRSGEYAGVVVRELVLDAVAPGQDFGPLRVAGKDLEDSLGIVGTPTVLFLDSHGREIVMRRVGYAPNDYAAYLLERSLKEAMRRASEAARVKR